MWKSVIYICLLLSCVCGQQLNDVSRAEFAADLIHVVGPNYLNENVIISPTSAQTVFALLALGARGETYEELVKGLHLEKCPTKEALATEYGHFMNLIKNEGRSMKTANHIYVGSSYDVSPQFAAFGEQYFDAPVERIDFRDKEVAAAHINSWVGQKTNGKINELVKSESLNDNTAVLLLNALHFKADWQYKFPADNTENREFSMTEGHKVLVPTMKSDKPLPIHYCQSSKLGLTAIELPYEGTQLKMLVLLPNKGSNVAQLQPKLTPVSLGELIASCTAESVWVQLPKFEIENEFDLKKHFQNMGMTNMFSDNADFADMLARNVPIKISEAKQKVFIKVDENGSEAAAATSVIGSDRMALSYKPEPIEFIADRPFAFAIRDNHAMYFVGHVMKPSI